MGLGAGKDKGDESAATDKLRIDEIRLKGKEAGAPKPMVDYLVSKGCTVAEADEAFATLERDGKYVAKNLATFNVETKPKP